MLYCVNQVVTRMHKQIEWHKMCIMRIMRNKKKRVVLNADLLELCMLRIVTSLFTQVFTCLRMFTHGYASYAWLHQSVLIGYAYLLWLLQMLRKFTLIYWDCYTCLRLVTGKLTHRQADLHGLLRMVTQNCYPWLRMVTPIVTQRNTWP